jgi:uncharacterized Tic20 family protein
MSAQMGCFRAIAMGLAAASGATPGLLDEPAMTEEPMQPPSGPTAAEPSVTPLAMRPDERGMAALCHLFTMLPVWALVANALIHFMYRESSRVVCFHARQGIHFNLLLLLLAVPVFLLGPVVKLLGVAGIHASTVNLIPAIGTWLLIGVYGLYAACCLIGVCAALVGRTWVYPLVGKAVWASEGMRAQ